MAARRFARPQRRVAAVDEQRGTRHEAGGLRRQEDGGRPEFGRIAPSRQRHVGLYLGTRGGIVQERCVDLGGEWPRAKRVDVNAVTGPFQSERSRQQGQAPLARCVRRAVGHRDLAQHARDVDHPSPLLSLHRPGHGRQHSQGPLRFVSITWSQSASASCSMGPRILIPALLTRMSIRPNRSSVRATISSTPDGR